MTDEKDKKDGLNYEELPSAKSLKNFYSSLLRRIKRDRDTSSSRNGKHVPKGGQHDISMGRTAKVKPKVIDIYHPGARKKRTVKKIEVR